MLLFNRLVVTTGDMPAIMPLVQEIVSIANGAGNPLQAWGLVIGRYAERPRRWVLR